MGNSPKTKRAPFWRGLVSMVLCAALVVGLASVLTLPAAAAGEGSFLASRVTALAQCLGWQSDQDQAQPLAPVSQPKVYAFEDWETRLQIQEENPVTPSFLNAQARFAWTTGAQILGQGEGNVIYSPLSLYYALSLAASGSRGETEGELLALLGVTDREELADQCANLYRLLYRDNEMGVLRLANSLWLDRDVTWQEDFVRQAAGDFYAQVFQEDLSDPATGEKMAAWVASQTGGMLRPAFQLEDADQVLAILNTVYFQDQWLDSFDADRTQPGSFTRADGSQVTWDFLRQTRSSASFARGENYLRASLSLKNAGSMTFVLPDEGVDLQTLLADPAALEEALTGGQTTYGEVVWQIPKFDSSCTLTLNQALQTLGVNQAFRPTADFSGITPQPAWISQVQQQTRVALTEEGVSAASFTYIGYSGSAMPQGRAEMILDRPFLYAITAPEGTLLFLGTCQDPTV